MKGGDWLIGMARKRYGFDSSRGTMRLITVYSNLINTQNMRNLKENWVTQRIIQNSSLTDDSFQDEYP